MKIPIYGSRMRTVMLSALSAAVSNGKINYNAGKPEEFWGQYIKLMPTTVYAVHA
jgi:hypothetical protein